MIGTVKWYNATKGFGFIHSEGKDYFLHVRAFKRKAPNELDLVPGQRLRFVPLDNPKGMQACEVEFVEVDGNS